jgi:hypothetical protein
MFVGMFKVTRDPCRMVGRLVCGNHLDRQPGKASDLEYTKSKRKKNVFERKKNLEYWPLLI